MKGPESKDIHTKIVYYIHKYYSDKKGGLLYAFIPTLTFHLYNEFIENNLSYLVFKIGST